MTVATGGMVASIIGALLVRVGEKPAQGIEQCPAPGDVVSFGFDPALFLTLPCIPLSLFKDSLGYSLWSDCSPTRAISEASQTGASTNIIRGFANGQQSTLLPIIFVARAIVLVPIILLMSTV